MRASVWYASTAVDPYPAAAPGPGHPADSGIWSLWIGGRVAVALRHCDDQQRHSLCDDPGLCGHGLLRAWSGGSSGCGSDDVAKTCGAAWSYSSKSIFARVAASFAPGIGCGPEP